VAGLELGTLQVGKNTFHDVRVRSRDARSLMFSHRDGLSSVRLRELPPEIQARLGYDPATAPADTPPPKIAPRPAPPSPPRKTDGEFQSTTRRLDQLFVAYASDPEVRAEQSLQSEFIRLNLAAKNQGRRPSCSIFAVVGALEFQNAQLTGGLEKLSEEYLIWATRRSLGLTGPAAVLPRDETGAPLADAGYSLVSVVTALQTYGIPRAEDMPNLPGLAIDDVPEPTGELVAKARSRRLVFISPLPGAEPAARIKALVHALNAGFPVPAGLRWPHERSINAGVLSGQRPLAGAAHAITFIGYHCPSGKLEETSFVFNNSYGPRWGQGGYGRATWGYLSQHLLEAYVLDVRVTDTSRQAAGR
jgi:hypothetical protein